MTKTNYKYYLANGECIEYSLPPDSSLIDLIFQLALDYFEVNGKSHPYPWEVWMQPQLVALLNKEYASTFGVMIGNFTNSIMKLETPAGSVIILAKPNMEFPIFIGSEQELRDNSFNASMEEILQS